MALRSKIRNFSRLHSRLFIKEFDRLRTHTRAIDYTVRKGLEVGDYVIEHKRHRLRHRSDETCDICENLAETSAPLSFVTLAPRIES